MDLSHQKDVLQVYRPLKNALCRNIVDTTLTCQIVDIDTQGMYGFQAEAQ